MLAGCWLAGCWLAGCWLAAGWLAGQPDGRQQARGGAEGTPRVLAIRPFGGNELVPGAHSYIQVAASRIQDTGYRILQATRGYRIQDTTCSTAKIQQGYRTHRIQDAGLILFLTAWRPLQAGAGGFLHTHK